MKNLLIATAASALLAGTAQAEDIKVGILLGFTGPAESYAPPMAGGARAALKEASESGAFLGGTKIEIVEADSTCTDAAVATASAERLITSEGVSGIIGALCSGATTAVLQNVALPNGMVMVSPSATSPALTALEDNGLFFRATPSDSRQGAVMAQLLKDKGYSSVAVTYTNNDYGKGLSDAFATNFTSLGGDVTINAAHEDGKADYSAEVGALASAGGELLVVVGYADQGGKGIIQASLDTGAFDTFHLPDAMVGITTEETFGSDLDGTMGQVPGTDAPGGEQYVPIGEANGFDATAPFSPESYDAAAMLVLAMQAAGSSDPADYKGKFYEVANAPGVEIYPGELKKGLEILASGGEVNLVGASAIELIEPGEAAGSYRVIETIDGKQVTVEYR